MLSNKVPKAPFSPSAESNLSPHPLKDDPGSSQQTFQDNISSKISRKGVFLRSLNLWTCFKGETTFSTAVFWNSITQQSYGLARRGGSFPIFPALPKLAQNSRGGKLDHKIAVWRNKAHVLTCTVLAVPYTHSHANKQTQNWSRGSYFFIHLKYTKFGVPLGYLRPHTESQYLVGRSRVWVL